MRYTEILEACWTGYQQQGMKKKGDRRVPNCVPVEEATGDPFLDNAARELLGFVLLFGTPFVIGAYLDIRNKLRKYQGREIIDALERKGVTMNRQTYDKVKPVLDRFDQALKDDDGAQAKALAKQIEQMIVMGKLSAPEPQAADTSLATKEKELAEDLKKWFKEKWVRFGPDGKIRGDCARGSESEGKPKCLPQSKAHALGKKGRASAAAKKRREDPNPERRGPARNVATKVREGIMDVVKQTFNDNVAGWPMGTSDEQFIQGWARDIKSRTGRTIPTEKLVQLYNHYAKRSPELMQTHGTTNEQGVAESNNDDWDDADEFGMPGSEFFPDDDRLRDGDYVRDRQDGEHGEIFRMSGDPSERRVRILDRDGKGWYISPERLVAVDRNDPDIMRYFGKRRHRDMDEASVAKKPQPYNDPKWIDKLTPAERSKLAGPNYKKINKEKQKEKVDEKQDACYRKVKSRYKVWPSAYASGALVQCRKKGAANWGTGSKKK